MELVSGALHGSLDIRPDATCGREESFASLFPLIEKSEQDEVRASYPELRHCGLLKRRPDACELCDLKDNPYKGKDVKNIKAARVNLRAVMDLKEMLDRVDLGIIRPDELLTLNAEDFSALLAVKRFKEYQKSKTLADLIAISCARMFFGTKEDK